VKVVDHAPTVLKRRSMTYRALGRAGNEGGDVALDDERPTGL
jgi:hypothetical protein